MSKTVPALIVFSGLPGTGKTTLAKALAVALPAIHLRIDTIENALQNSVLKIEPYEDVGYQVAYALARDNLRLDHNVIADSVNLVEITRDAYHRVAADCGVPCLDIELVCSDVHEHRQRVEQRTSDLPGQRLPDWQSVIARDFEPWTSERITMDTAGRSVEQCTADLVASVRGITLPKRA